MIDANTAELRKYEQEIESNEIAFEEMLSILRDVDEDEEFYEYIIANTIIDYDFAYDFEEFLKDR